MKRRGGGHGEEEENAERWLLTYADMITLLLALFIILYSISNVNAQKFEELADAGKGYTGAETGQGSGGSGAGDGTGIAEEEPLDAVFRTISAYIDSNELETQLSIEQTQNYVRIQLKDQFMFQPNTAVLLQDSLPIIKDLATLIYQIYDEVDYVTFSGHTADVGARSLANDRNAWRLSSERALTVLTEFIQDGVEQDKLSIQGFSHYVPVDTSGTPDGLAKNRRVEITIFKYSEGKSADVTSDIIGAEGEEEVKEAPKATPSQETTKSTH